MEKTLRFDRALVAAMATVALILTSLIAQPVSSDASESIDASASYTGEELFDGLMLSSGPLAVDHPELLMNHAPGGPVAASTLRELHHLISAENATFFELFETGVTSGDPYQIRDSLYDGIHTLSDVLHSTNGSRGTSLGADVGASPNVDTVCSAMVCSYAFVIVLAVAVAIVAPFAFALRTAGPDGEIYVESPTDSSQKITLDDWVGKIAQTL